MEKFKKIKADAKIRAAEVGKWLEYRFIARGFCIDENGSDVIFLPNPDLNRKDQYVGYFVYGYYFERDGVPMIIGGKSIDQIKHGEVFEIVDKPMAIDQTCGFCVKYNNEPRPIFSHDILDVVDDDGVTVRGVVMFDSQFNTWSVVPMRQEAALSSERIVLRNSGRILSYNGYLFSN